MIAHQEARSPIVTKSRVPPLMITRLNFEFPWLDVRGAKTMGLSPIFHQSVFFFINLFSLQEMSKEKVTKGHQKVFQDDWLDNPQFKPLLSRVKNEKHKFWCDVCQRVLGLSISGQSALSDHAKGKKHMDSLMKRNSFFKNAKVKKVTTEIGEPSSVSNVNPPWQQTLEECIGCSDSTRSEIVWILNSKQ